MNKSYLTASLLAMCVSASAASAAGIQFNIIEAEAPTNNSFVDLGIPAGSPYNITNLGFGLVQSATVEEALTDHAFWYRYEDSSFQNDYLFDMAGIEIGETSERDQLGDGISCALVGGLAGFFSGDDCRDTGDVAAGTYTGDDMEFTSDQGVNAVLGDAGFGIFYDLDGNSDWVFLAFADQGAGADADYDDLIVKTKGMVNVVPLPAAGWMLLAGVGGMAAMKRRKKKAS